MDDKDDKKTSHLNEKTDGTLKNKLQDAVPCASAAFIDNDLSSEVNGSLASTFNVNKDAYDSAIDYAYNNGAGSSATHHITDGSHTFWGAFHAAQDASPNDSHVQEASNAFEHLMRDLTSNSGINPVVSMEPETLSKIKDTLENRFDIPRSWTNDMATVNAFEAVGASLVAVSAIYGFKKKDYTILGKVIGSSSVTSLVSANPLMAAVAVVTAAKCWKEANVQEKRALKKNIFKGGAVALTVKFISAAIGGPVLVGVVAGLYGGYLMNNFLSGKKSDDILTKTLKEVLPVVLKKLVKTTLRTSAKGIS